MTILKIAGIGILGTLLALQFKSGKSEYGIYVGIAVSLLLFFAMSGQLELIVETVRLVGSYVDLDNLYLSVMLKMLGVTYLAEFAAGICRDAGYQSIAGQVELFAKLTILALGLPALRALLETIRGFWG